VGDVARVFARLVDAAEDDVADFGGIDLVARHHFLDHLGREVVGPHRGELAGVAADWAAQSVINECFEHLGVPFIPVSVKRRPSSRAA
jgi:hypothetical protein